MDQMEEMLNNIRTIHDAQMEEVEKLFRQDYHPGHSDGDMTTIQLMATTNTLLFKLLEGTVAVNRKLLRVLAVLEKTND